MEGKVRELIERYEGKLQESEEAGHENCYSCCDYTQVGAYETSVINFISDLKRLVEG